MSSIAFNSHDEYFQPDPAYPANEVYAVHPVSELKQYARLANEYGVKLEIESFHTGAFWNINKLREEPGLLPDPLWITLFLGWPGGSWTPPTAAGLQYLVNNLPPRANWNMSCMDPSVYWSVVAHSIALGGNVRIGMEIVRILKNGEFATTNALLVEKAVRIANEVGRGIASPDETRRMTDCPKKPQLPGSAYPRFSGWSARQDCLAQCFMGRRREQPVRVGVSCTRTNTRRIQPGVHSQVSEVATTEKPTPS